MPDYPAISSHGTLISRAAASTPTNYVIIGELGDLTMPGLTRNEFDATPQNRDIDSYVAGVLRREPLQFPVFFRWDNPTHDEVSGLHQALIDNETCGWKLTAPDGGEMIFSGFVKGIVPTNPVDGIQTAQVTVRPSGPFWLNGSLIGAAIAQ